jgi:hypothetical protein
LRKALGPLAKRNGFAARVVDFYDDPKKAKREWRKGLRVETARHDDGLPKLTFAVFDSCVIQHYLDEHRKRELGAVLNAIGRHAKPTRSGAKGVARFCLEGGGDDFRFVLDYAKKAVFLEYEATVTVDFRDEEAKKSAPTDQDAWARVFELSKTAKGRKQLDKERRAAKEAALLGIHLRLSPSKELISIEPIDGETTKVRWYHGKLTAPTAVQCLVVDKDAAERRADHRTKKAWRTWPRVEDPTELLRIVELLGEARSNCKPKNKVVGEKWFGWGDWY